MDYSFTAEQDDAAHLAARILGDHATPARLQAVERSGERFDAELWRALGDAGLIGLALPEEHDGAGLGLVELCRVLVEAGRLVAPVPLAAHGAASLLLAELGTPAQRTEWLAGAASGERVLAAATAEDRSSLPQHPTTAARADGDGYRVTGTKTVVGAGTLAHGLLVTASSPSGPAVFLVRPDDAGVTLVVQTVSDGDPVARIELADVVLGPERLLGAPDGSATARLHDLVTITVCAEQLGVTEGALRLTAAYAGTREQFGRPIGTFQAVSQRLADGYIDVLGQRLMLWQAAWRLAEGLPVTTEVAAAKLWAADAGHRLAHTAVHVHGGVGIDLDGETHRYFTHAKRLELVHGGATEQALCIGRTLAAEPV
ncbi:acyl-CoA dehydrogenase [Nocardioides sp. dk4132]|uniref:acyl-CoA dehydrogenase family protein n=1 Tax=unclassified Nocardioides TaxID=2615069 RepID=UPI0012981B2F|nr:MULTISPECIES: acyl-CoA dehydrogenase family protein [unclassified Nocardioides]MQW75042.1 acyl-CoA dehydrogenase [Nocardioides sp. dk4132]QGA07785.1 acyl-CoA dehydrogenase [Nocardioides sp. dk884]